MLTESLLASKTASKTVRSTISSSQRSPLLHLPSKNLLVGSTSHSADVHNKSSPPQLESYQKYEQPEQQQQIRGESDRSVKDNFASAALFYIISMAFSSSQSVFGKLLYEAQPNLSTYQLLAYRALFSTLINIFTINIRAKEVLWDSLPAGSGKQLLIRVA